MCYLLLLVQELVGAYKFMRANNSNFMTKNLRKAIMKRSKLGNKYLRVKTDEAKSLYSKQRNLCVSFLLKNIRDYFGNLDNKIVSDNRLFWRTFSEMYTIKRK